MNLTRSFHLLASLRRNLSSSCGRTGSRSPLPTRPINPLQILPQTLGLTRRLAPAHQSLPLVTRLQQSPNGGLAGSFPPKNRPPRRTKTLKRASPSISLAACGCSLLFTTDWDVPCPSVGYCRSLASSYPLITSSLHRQRYQHHASRVCS